MDASVVGRCTPDFLTVAPMVKMGLSVFFFENLGLDGLMNLV